MVPCMVIKGSEAAARDFLLKKVCLKISQISQENTCAGDSRKEKKETPAQMFSSEIFKNTYFEGHLRTTDLE